MIVNQLLLPPGIMEKFALLVTLNCVVSWGKWCGHHIGGKNSAIARIILITISV